MAVHSIQGGLDPATDIIAAIRSVPDSTRTYSASPELASRLYGIEGQLIEKLVSEGLPHDIRDGRRLFDELDLENVSLYLERRSGQRLAMRTWAATVDRIRTREVVNYRISFYVGDEVARDREIVLRVPEGVVLCRNTGVGTPVFRQSTGWTVIGRGCVAMRWLR